MDEVDGDEENVPDDSVEIALNSPAPQREEHAADQHSAAEVQHAVEPIGRQIRQEKERVRQLEVKVIGISPFCARAAESSSGRHLMKGTVVIVQQFEIGYVRVVDVTKVIQGLYKTYG